MDFLILLCHLSSVNCHLFDYLSATTLLMRIFLFFLSATITAALVYVLDNRWGAVPPLGRFLSPQQGFWQNAEAVDKRFDGNLQFSNLKGRASVFFDDRMVPHIFAEHDEDAFFVQGYLHARFRLWQMEFQTHAAAGRISEILGSDPRFLHFDREQRRLGMVYAAENALKEMEKNPVTKIAADAYTAGINAYIGSLTESQLPVEYKLLGYQPEQWSNLKIALFLKMMTKDLAGYERDLEFTNAKAIFNSDDLELLYPQLSDSSMPIIEKGTLFGMPAILPVVPETADKKYFKKDTTVRVYERFKPNRRNGSNNWAVSGTKTASGAPMLCNDPHLGLSLPSIWYEMQIRTPSMNVYGATFPGAPSVIIGFNDHVAFGFTNAMRDVKDYYQVRFQDETRSAYWFDSTWVPTQKRIEQIRIRDSVTVADTVAYTVFGPVLFDADFNADGNPGNTALAVRWIAHDPSNEAFTWLKLNKAKNYNDYLEAIKDYAAPGQNMLFAAKTGDIALWHQGKFPAYWNGQGLYVMPGEDSSYMWQGFIPQQENPHVMNPGTGYIQSANQRPVDMEYFYFIPGNYIVPRGITLTRRLDTMQNIRVTDMMELQNDVYDGFAAAAVPLLLRHTDTTVLTAQEQEYFRIVRDWDFRASATAAAPSVFQAWWDSLDRAVWTDDLARVKLRTVPPDDQTTLEQLLRDSSFAYVDNLTTPELETLHGQVTTALKRATADLQKMEKDNRLLWWKVKNTSVYHLLRSAVSPFAATSLEVGGWRTTINAITDDHGPSWRMIVHLTSETEAYGIYPGGQNGNPGSRYYDNFIEGWRTGKYYPLWVMKEQEGKDPRVKGVLQFSKS